MPWKPARPSRARPRRQPLRAAQLRAEALAAHGDEAAAVALIDETLAAARRPDADTRVRTPRYLRALEETRARIADAPQP